MGMMHAVRTRVFGVFAVYGELFYCSLLPHAVHSDYTSKVIDFLAGGRCASTFETVVQFYPW